MPTIVERLEDVRREAQGAWRHGDAVSAWARPFGEDLRGAWEACHRGDFLATLTPLVGLDLLVLHRHVHRIVAELVELIPDYAESFSEMVALIQVGSIGQPVPTRVWEVQDAIVTSLRREERAADEQERADRPSTMRAIARAIRSAREASANAPYDRRTTAFREALRIRLSGAPEMLTFRERHREKRLRVAAAFALRALLGGLTFAKVSDATAAIHSYVDIPMPAPKRLELRRKLRINACRLAAFAADISHQAGLAYGWVEGASDSTWNAGLESFVAAASVEEHGEPDGSTSRADASWECLEVRVSERINVRLDETLWTYAQDLRRTGTGHVMRFAPNQEDPSARSAKRVKVVDSESGSGATAREMMRDDLERMAVLARHLGAAPLLTAVDVALTMLGSDGALEPSKLARVMVTVHARFVDLIRDTARELGQLDSEEWRTIADGLEQNFRSMVEALSGDLSLEDSNSN